MLKTVLIGCALVSMFACGVPLDARDETASQESALGVTGSTGTTAKLKCRNVGSRWQVCGDASRTKILVGVGIRFYKPDASGALVAASDTHASCDAALADTTVPSFARSGAEAVCGQVYALAMGELTAPVPVIVNTRGTVLSYGSLSADEQRVVNRAVLDLIAADPGVQAIGCGFGPGLAISCWGNGKICSAWIDEDGVGAQCSPCQIATCD
jgi:hypothetical protein